MHATKAAVGDSSYGDLRGLHVPTTATKSANNRKPQPGKLWAIDWHRDALQGPLRSNLQHDKKLHACVLLCYSLKLVQPAVDSFSGRLLHVDYVKCSQPVPVSESTKAGSSDL